VGQIRQAMQNLGAVLEAGGGSLEALVKISVYLADLGDYEVVNGIFTDFFGEAPPARELVEVARIPRDAAVEISAVGVVGS
ncbi:MAG: Rid family hydrolase, partial [Terriglobia bacterium]